MNKFEFDYLINNNKPNSASTDSSSKSTDELLETVTTSSNSASSFEKRICQLIDGLCEHCKKIPTLDEQNSCTNLTSAQLYLDNEHEGKTLLHLCAESGLNTLFEHLLHLKNIINSLNDASKYNLMIIINELELYKLDHHGYTALMLACKNNNQSIAEKLFKLHQFDYEITCNSILDFSTSNFYFNTLKSIDEANKNSNSNLALKLNDLLIKYQNELIVKSSQTGTDPSNENANTNNLDDFHLIENLDELTSLLTDDSKTDDNSVNNKHENLIDNRNQDDQNAGVANDDTDYHNLFSSFENTIVNLDDNCVFDPSNTHDDELVNIINANRNDTGSNHHHQHHQEIMSIDQNQPQMISNLPSNNILIEHKQATFVSSSSSASTSSATMSSNSSFSSSTAASASSVITKVDDDQDKKIKTLADNIIAAMPHKIKTNSYSSSNLQQQQQQQLHLQNNMRGIINDNQNINTNFSMFRPINLLRRNATSFDDSSYDSNYRAPVTRSSLSPTSLTFNQLANSDLSQHIFVENRSDTGVVVSSPVTLLHDSDSTNSSSLAGLANINQVRLMDDSPGDDSTCSSTFHIDSPPSTAEFCQYFHAASSSGYYKHAIETGFSQLTLTDDEQRELYEAALVIQNAYRRYIQRKKKR